MFTKLAGYNREGLKMFASSSFQTHSLVMLHLLTEYMRLTSNPSPKERGFQIPVYFLNTGYLFPETLTFRDRIAAEWNLKIISLHSPTPKNQQKDSLGKLLFTSDPDYCCYLNKIQPMEPVLAAHDVWINGVRADQTETRKQMQEEETYAGGGIRFHPMLQWTNKMIEQYIAEHKIQRHPLDNKGYQSIGCEPCTRKIDLELMADPRLSRWFGLNKTECGLHTDLIEKASPQPLSGGEGLKK